MTLCAFFENMEQMEVLAFIHHYRKAPDTVPGKLFFRHAGSSNAVVCHLELVTF